MGTTCANLHIVKGMFLSGSDICSALPKAYAKLGFAPLKKKADASTAERTVIALPDAGENVVSVFDSNNVDLDSGDLKELAVIISKQLKTPVIVSTIYDSDYFEWVIFVGGKQSDAVHTEGAERQSDLKILKPKQRALKWLEWFGSNEYTRPALSSEPTPFGAFEALQKKMEKVIASTLATGSVFAEDTVAGLCRIAGVGIEAATSSFAHILEDAEDSNASMVRLAFQKKDISKSVAGGAPQTNANEIVLRSYLSEDDCPYHTLYPASWPIAQGENNIIRWMITTHARGFTGCDIEVALDGAEHAHFTEGMLVAHPFYNGQVTSPKAVAEAKWEPTDQQAKTLQLSFPDFAIPDLNPEAKKQIILQLCVGMKGEQPEDFTMRAKLRTHGEESSSPPLADVRIRCVDTGWVPLVSGGAPTAGHAMQLSRPTRLINHDALSCATAILADAAHSTINGARKFAESWVKSMLSSNKCVMRIHSQKHMTEAAYVGKSTRVVPLSADACTGKNWDQLFNPESNLQCVELSIVPDQFDHPIAGLLLEFPLKAYESKKTEMIEVLSKMTGAEQIDTNGTLDPCLHVTVWTCNAPEAASILGISAQQVTAGFTDWLETTSMLQAWSANSGQVPILDRYDNYGQTLYEATCSFSWFRSGMNGLLMYRGWCANKVRYIAPQMWLSNQLLQKVDVTRLAEVALVTDRGMHSKMQLRKGASLADLEQVLLPLLPLESHQLSASR